MNRILILSLAAAAAIAAAAGMGYIELAPGGAAPSGGAGKVLAAEGGWRRERVVMGEEEIVSSFASTNYTYTVITTNGAAAVTNVLDRPHPMPLPPHLKSYTTNTVVTVWSETNRVPVVLSSATNAVSAGMFLAPGDGLLAASTNTAPARLWIER